MIIEQLSASEFTQRLGPFYRVHLFRHDYEEKSIVVQVAPDGEQPGARSEPVVTFRFAAPDANKTLEQAVLEIVALPVFTSCLSVLGVDGIWQRAPKASASGSLTDVLPSRHVCAPCNVEEVVARLKGAPSLLGEFSLIASNVSIPEMRARVAAAEAAGAPRVKPSSL